MTRMVEIFDREAGAKARAALAVVLGICTVLVAAANAVLENIDALPPAGWVGSVAMVAQATVTYVGRFTSIADKAVD